MVKIRNSGKSGQRGRVKLRATSDYANKNGYNCYANPCPSDQWARVSMLILLSDTHSIGFIQILF